MHVDDFDSVFTQPIDPAMERARLAHDDCHDAELPDEAAAVPARRERRDHDRVLVAPLATGTAERIGLAMDGRVVILDPPIVPPAEQRAVAVEEGGADGDAPFGKSRPGFLNGNLEHCLVIPGSCRIIRHHRVPYSRSPASPKPGRM